MNTLQTTKAYECSKTNATVNIANNEWINEFPEIKLEKGDSVRLLGSFVNETSSGDSIEIDNDMEINIQYSPYLKAQTFFTADQGTDLIDIGKIGDIPYSTDSFGIEPPGWWFQDGQATDGSPTNRVSPNFTYDCSKDNLFGDVYSTGTGKIHFNTGASQWQSQNNYARTWGTNIKTYNNNDTQQTATDFNERNIYADWKNFSCDNELYLAGLVKKLILPVLYNVDSSTDSYNGGNFRFEDLVLDPPAAGEGMLAGVPKPGMCIATVDIAGATGFFDEDGNSYFENNAPFGKCNLTAGPQSVIGEILAVRPIKHLIRGKWTDCFEVMVHNWISPASLRTKPIARDNLVATTLTNVQATKADNLKANQVTGLANVNCIIQIHGSGEKIRDYNTNSTYNNINGMVNKANTTKANPSNNNGINSGVPDNFFYDDIQGRTSGTFPAGTAAGNVNNGLANFKLSCLDKDLNDFKVGYGKPQGLSFLWNGTYGSQLRYPHLEIPTPNPSGIMNRTRASSQFVLERTGAFGGINLTLSASYLDNQIDTTGNPALSIEPLVSPCCGAYVICKPQTMKDIINGQYQRVDEGRADGRIARWWHEYSYQYKNSEYSERHYTGNAMTQTGPFTAGHEPGDNTSGGQAPYQSVVAGIPPRDEYRYNYEMIGKPGTQNWRRRAVTGIGPVSEPYEKGLIEGGFFSFATGVGPCDTTDPNFLGDSGGNIMSTRYGYNEGAPNGWIETTAPGGPSHAHFGCPFEKVGYETSINSIYFQDKETGDCNLGINYETGVANGDYQRYTVDTISAAGSSVLSITCIDINNPTTPVLGALVRVFPNDNTFPYLEKDVTVTNVNPLSAFQFQITISVTFVPNIEIGSKVQLSPTTTGSITSCGLGAVPWAGDMLILREHTAKYKVPAGFYSEVDLANTLDDRLHFNKDKYKSVFSQNNLVPTNVGKKEQALASQNSVIFGNFVHTYIPDLNYGFTPVTQEVANNTTLDASTVELTDTLYTYEITVGGGGNINFYYPDDLPAYDGLLVRKVTDNSVTYPTVVGKHTKIYSVPYLKYNRINKQIHLIRLRGGALNQEDATLTVAPAPIEFQNWNLKESRFVGFYEGLRDLRTNQSAENAGNTGGSAYSGVWRTRLNRNLLSNGGSAKIFCGANNFTVSYVEQVNRFSLNNLYTPLRPHTSENKQGQGAFGVDDAVPSAIIAAELTGAKEDMLSGIYINKLNGDVFTQENYGLNWYNDELFDTLSQSDLTTRGNNFLDTMGFTSSQLSNFNNSFTNNNLFVFNGLNDISGTAIRVGAKITPSINGSNPFANSCSLIAPVNQYFVEVDTDDFFALKPATKGKSPYYYIGSDFPTKEFFGNDNGAKLPVIGICARNFHSMNFSFDLGASSISYTVDENVTITSIHTAIYTSELKVPQNLSSFSSIIYLITKNKYYNSLPQADQLQKAEIIEQNYSAPLTPYFFNPAPSNYRSAPPPVIPRNYFTNQGNIPEDYDSDDDIEF